MSYSVFKEVSGRISPFILFAEQKGILSISASDDDESVKGEKKEGGIPQLSYLRVELDRLRPGMSDYIVRVSTPKYDSEKKSNTVVSIRGNRNLAKYDSVKKLAEVIGKEMVEREDETHDWENLDAGHLADLLAGCLKFFSITTHADRLQFTTEALA